MIFSPNKLFLRLVAFTAQVFLVCSEFVDDVQIICRASGKQAPTWPSKAAYLREGARKAVCIPKLYSCVMRESGALMSSKWQTITGYKTVIKRIGMPGSHLLCASM